MGATKVLLFNTLKNILKAYARANNLLEWKNEGFIHTYRNYSNNIFCMLSITLYLMFSYKAPYIVHNIGTHYITHKT